SLVKHFHDYRHFPSFPTRRSSDLMLFVGLWMFVIYFPLAHMVWGSTGLMNGVWNADAAIKTIDFAGGTVVHMSSGWSALILCMRSEEHTSELQSRENLVCRLLLEK